MENVSVSSEVVDKFVDISGVIAKPDITGWAQVRGPRGETDTPEKLASRIKFDIRYIEEWSLFFDLVDSDQDCHCLRYWTKRLIEAIISFAIKQRSAQNTNDEWPDLTTCESWRRFN
jgi:hypothetical protein